MDTCGVLLNIPEHWEQYDSCCRANKILIEGMRSFQNILFEKLSKGVKEAEEENLMAWFNICGSKSAFKPLMRFNLDDIVQKREDMMALLERKAVYYFFENLKAPEVLIPVIISFI